MNSSLPNKSSRNWIRHFALFILINFGALAIGGLFTKEGVNSPWYQGLIKAPWTPPGWVFGAAWTTIMLCFSLYLANLWVRVQQKRTLLIFFIMQWILNVGWNPIFFHLHFIALGLIVITSLLALVLFICLWYRKEGNWNWIWISPYIIWLFIATSLNAYILWANP